MVHLSHFGHELHFLRFAKECTRVSDVFAGARNSCHHQDSHHASNDVSPTVALHIVHWPGSDLNQGT
jgi:hypothetical protein